MEISFSDYLIAFMQLINGDRLNGEMKIADERESLVMPLLNLEKPIDVLDLANGSLRPQYTLLKSSGHNVVGIDLVNRVSRGWKSMEYRIARWFFRIHLLATHNSIPDRLVCGDVTHLPFKKNCFNLVTSIAAFEHFLYVPLVVQELYRVLRPGGVAYIRIHLFTSPSGGHSFKLMEIPLKKLPKGVDAWDHLRKRRLPFHVPLNEWRIDQYLDEFRKHFEIVKHYCAMREGEHFLTPEIEAELADYSRDELTCGAYVIVARKA